MARKLQLELLYYTRRQWGIKNPILQEGEMAIETDTGKFKIGNGENRWDDLPYLGGQDAQVVTAIVVKGNGNSGSGEEDGDYRFIPNGDNQMTIQYMVDDAWDTENETIIATPS